MTLIRGIKKWEGFNEEGTYLVLISPESIPHLVLISKGVYYSLTHKKSIIGESALQYLKFLERSGKSILFAELRIEPLGLSTIFERYEKANTKEITCLVPIREAILPNSRAEFVFELIPELQEQDLISSFYHLNLENELYEHDQFQLKIYTKAAIFSYIESLNEKYAKRR